MSSRPDASSRFSGRVDHYQKTRPTYPAGVLALLRETCALDASSTVADLGSGTGLFTQLLLESGATVHAVEPNAEMRAAAEARLAPHPRFRSVAGSAEATTLPDASVDLVTAAQSFHWFDVAGVHAELQRIVRPRPGADVLDVALVWNDRDLESTPFLREYEALLSRLPKYRELQGKADSVAKFDALLGAGAWRRRTLPNEQRLDRDGLVGRLASSSYAPSPGEEGHERTFAELRAIFDRHASAGEIVMPYTTVIILGRIATK